MIGLLGVELDGMTNSDVRIARFELLIKRGAIVGHGQEILSATHVLDGDCMEASRGCLIL